MAKRRPKRSSAKKRTSSRPSGVKDLIQGGIVTLRDQAGSGASQVTELIREEGGRFLEARKVEAAEGIQAVGAALRLAADKLHDRNIDGIGDYADSAADGIDRVARYVEDRELGEIAESIERFAREHPGAVLGGVFLAGVVASRVFRAAR